MSLIPLQPLNDRHFYCSFLRHSPCDDGHIRTIQQKMFLTTKFVSPDMRVFYKQVHRPYSKGNKRVEKLKDLHSSRTETAFLSFHLDRITAYKPNFLILLEHLTRQAWEWLVTIETTMLTKLGHNYSANRSRPGKLSLLERRCHPVSSEHKFACRIILAIWKQDRRKPIRCPLDHFRNPNFSVF